MPIDVPNTIDPMATQMAALLTRSDLDELREVVKRWVATAETQSQRRIYDEMGKRMIELKAALAEAPVQPTHAELETALTMMLRLAASNPDAKPPRG
jgi:urease accessory protein UreF